MRIWSTSKKPRSGQVILLFSLMITTILIPMVGLAIDGGRGYLVRLKLSTAVDGAALAGARLMGTGVDYTAQVANATATVKLYVAANFPAKFFGADVVGDPVVCVDPGADTTDPCKVNQGKSGVNTFRVRTVVVSATARMPTLFMHVIGLPTVAVNANGVASRRDVRVVLVMDRSNSMIDFYTGGKQPPPYINSIALDFVNSFSGSTKSGRDELGLVVYGGSAIIAYPPRVLTADYTDYKNFTPPNKDFALPANIPQYLTELQGGSNTGTAEALYLAHMMLRADSDKNNQLANKLNVIVLFTDGIPNGITTFANDTDGTVSKPMIAACTDRNKGNWSSTPLVSGANTNMIGWFAQGGGNQAGSKQAPFGLFKPMMAYPYPFGGNDIDQYMKNPNADAGTNYITQMAGCSGASPMTAMTKIPDRDLYGNYTDLGPAKVPPVAVPILGSITPPVNGADGIYTLGTLFSNPTQCAGTRYSGTAADACQVGLASWSAAAHQAWKIWNQIIWDKKTQKNITDPGLFLSQPVIFTIGFNSSATDKPDFELLKMIANDPSSKGPFSARMNGESFNAATPGDVKRAFEQISSQILRLSQ